MKKLIFLSWLFLVAGYSLAQTAPKYPEVDIPYKKYVLDNGLTLLVHEDHKAPVIAFNIWYHVGSKNEKPGKTGFAHLFEHLMFNGSEHYNQDYFKALEAIGATNLNGTTNPDRTNYFQNFPVEALDKVLWLESDRMGFMLPVIDSARLEEQRGVVQNEKRQGENQPYGIAWSLISQNTYPTGHPYSWTTIGSMEDLNAASLEDVKEWFSTYYGPNNAVVCIAGDITPDVAYEKVKKYFGDIPAGPPIARQKTWIAKMSGKHIQVAQDRVPQPRLYKVWNIPPWGTQELAYLNVLADLLVGGKSSRLYKRLVYDEQLSTNVRAFTDQNEIGSQFFIQVDAKPGHDLAKINRIVDEEMQKILTGTITASELDRAKMLYFTYFVNGLERIGGFGGKSDLLAMNETYAGSADHYKQINKWRREATADDLKKVAREWLTDGEYQLHVLPYGTFTATKSTLDRTREPDLGSRGLVAFPEVKEFSLSNGLKVALVERHSLPSVNVSLMVNAGCAADQFGSAGLATLTGQMLTEGTKTRNSLQISDKLAALGATLKSVSDLDNTYLNMTTLSSTLGSSLQLMADVVLNPSFPQKDFERVRQQQLLKIKQEGVVPFLTGIRILPSLLYAKGHAYSNPLTGTGTEESVNKLSRNDLVAFHQTWFTPNNATLVVVGDVTVEKLKPLLEANLAGWRKKDVPVKNISPVALPEKPTVYVMDKPGALQSVIFGGVISPSGTDPDFEAIQMMNRILGGEFTSRINMNLREDKHWSYGAQAVNFTGKGPGFYTTFAPVQTDKTKESVAELLKELNQYVGDKPATEEEFRKVQTNAVMQLPGLWETNEAVLNSLRGNLAYDRGMDYLKNYPDMLQNLTLDAIHKAAKKVVKPAQTTWLIVGDRAKIEQGIRELNIGPLVFIDAGGKVMEE